MEVVVTLCIQCNTELGRFRNSWNGIGNSYHSPVYPPVSVNGLEAIGPIYNGAKNSYIEHSHLQDISCMKCQTIVGLRCESAPEGHMLKENQLIMRLTNMYVVNEYDGEKAKISILKSFPLSINSGKKPSGDRRAATVQPSRRNVHSAHSSPSWLNQAMVSRKSSPDNRLSLPPTGVTTSQVTKFKNWAEDTINSQQKHIDRISGTVDRLERDMSLFKDFMLEVRSELGSTRQISDSVGEEDLLALREELNGSREQVEQCGQAISRVNSDFYKRRLEAIAHNVEQVSQKAKEVDELKLELARMRARVKFLESQSHVPPTSNRQLRPDPGTNKRRQGGMDNLRSPSEDSPAEPIQKRRKVVLNSPHGEDCSATSDVEKTRDRQTTPNREIIEILSSEHDPSSPNRGPDDEKDRPNAPRNAEIIQSSIPNSTFSTYVLEESSGNRQAYPSMQTPTTHKATSAVPRPGSSRVEVCVPCSATLTPSLQQPGVRVRDSNGVLLLPSGKVDGRSLRYKKHKTSKENVAQDHSEEPGFTEAGRGTHVTRSKGTAMMTSTPASGGQDSAPKSHTSSMNPITCNICDRNFKNRFAFNAHKCLRAKTPGGQNIAARELVLAERERMVRATLERELGR
ncbi:hypothetical protein BKA64DRAFT_673318 [Cadophora sp. MPI-SDFR-AT-0126]|nr:hypothetical protein BKA64DRAFT_673318 [Leotiomycetes sp. MPI-SDFR-AT-0126]